MVWRFVMRLPNVLPEHIQELYIKYRKVSIKFNSYPTTTISVKCCVLAAKIYPFRDYQGGGADYAPMQLIEHILRYVFGPIKLVNRCHLY